MSKTHFCGHRHSPNRNIFTEKNMQSKQPILRTSRATVMKPMYMYCSILRTERDTCSAQGYVFNFLSSSDEFIEVFREIHLAVFLSFERLFCLVSRAEAIANVPLRSMATH